MAADPSVSPVDTPATSSEPGSAPESRSGLKGSRPTDSGSEVSPADTPAKDRTPWPAELMHTDLCAWRFGGKCDCGKDGETDA